MSQFPSQKAELVESNGILRALQEIAARIGFLSAVRGIAADLRVTVLGGTLASVTTVSTVTTVATVSGVTTVTTLSNIQNFGSVPAQMSIFPQMNIGAVVGNINNLY